ncbi:hypothetical protein ACQPW3_29010 [Actinosynnema sp. CA-248983]
MTSSLARDWFAQNVRSLAAALPIQVRDVAVDVRETRDDVVSVTSRAAGLNLADPPLGPDQFDSIRRILLWETESVPVSIYLSDEEGHDRVEAAVEGLLRGVGGEVVERDDPVVGSWFRRMRARIGGAARSEAGQEVTAMAVHAAEARLVHLKDAEVTAKMMENLGPVLEALQPSAHAVIRVGALLIVKVDGVVAVHQLTARQQLRLDHRPELALSPHDVVAALDETERREEVEQRALEGD